MAIRIKLAILYGVLVTVIMVLLGAIRYVGYKEMLQNQKDYSLRVVADILDASFPGKIVSKETIQKTVTRLINDYPDIEWKGILIEVYDVSRSNVFSSSLSEEKRLFATNEVWIKVLQRKTDLTTVSMYNDTAPMRILTKSVFRQNDFLYLIQVGSSMQDIESNLENILWVNILFIPVTALLVSMGGWFLTKRALKPLDEVIKTASNINSGDLSHRIEVKQASEEIQKLALAFNQMITRLESSFQQIRDFSDNASHELRIPLAILKGQTELSLRRMRSEEEYRNTLKSNLEEIERMEKIVERLLFLSRADRGEVTLNLIRINLNDLVRDVCSKFLIPIQEKGIRVLLNMNGPVYTIGDELLLREVLLNLIQNAVTYTPGEGEISLGLEYNKDKVIISVSDSGCGIPEGDIPRIFDRFYQVNKSRSSKGSGLGLSICQWIVRAHNGKIEVKSKVDQGSWFTISLPLIKD